jgi:pimeloyl-ACP methyl ester carboxylesterase
MGAVAAMSYAATDPKLAGVVVVSSPADWRIPFRIRALIAFTLARTKLGRFFAERHTHVRIYPEWNPSEPPRSMAKKVVSAVPLAIVHGRNDRLIPFHFSLGVSSDDLPDAHAVVVPGMGHAFDPVGYEPICDALEWTLNNSASRAVSISDD